MQLFNAVASRPSKRGQASFSLLVVLLVATPMMFAACGDDGNVLGSDGSGGSAGGGSAGSSSAGAGHAGAPAGAGTSHDGGGSGGGASSGGDSSSGAGSGGATDSGGSGSGGSSSCSSGECVRANVCLDHCGGDVVYTGCCPCAANTVEQTTCAAAGGQGSGGGASGACVGATCTTSQSCVAYRTVGGAVDFPDTHGMCGNGEHVEGNTCQPDFSYTCAELTGCSAPSASCRCAATTHCASTTTCRTPSASAWLDDAAELVCEQQVP